MAEDGGLGEGGGGEESARGSEGVLPLKSLKSRNSSILGILRVLFMIIFLYTSLIHFSLICLSFLDNRNFV